MSGRSADAAPSILLESEEGAIHDENADQMRLVRIRARNHAQLGSGPR